MPTRATRVSPMCVVYFYVSYCVTYQETVAVHASHDSLAFEDALGVLLVESEENSRSISQLI